MYAILKFLGIGIAWLAGILGTLTDFKKKDSQGRTRVTRWGIVAMAISTAGLVIAIVSVIMDETVKTRQIKESYLVDIPLRSLAIDWEFSGVSNGLIELYENQQDELDSILDEDDNLKYLSQHKYQRIVESLYIGLRVRPWLNVLCTGKWSDTEVKMLLFFPSPAGRAVLPVGEMPNTKLSQEMKEQMDAPEIWEAELTSYGFTNRAKRLGDQFQFSWEYPSDCLSDSICKQHADLELSCRLPDEIVIVLLAEFDPLLPGLKDYISLDLDEYEIAVQVPLDEHVLSCITESRLTLIANELLPSRTRYSVRLADQGRLTTIDDYENTRSEWCTVAVYRGRRNE